MTSVPPLEDVPELLEKIKLSDQEFTKNRPEKKSNINSTSSSFGGMKKGFLYGKPSKSQKQQKLISSSSRPAVTELSSRPEKSSLVLTEVQEAMKDHDPARAYQQVVKAQLSSNSTVGDILEDPAWLPILDEFQKDPEAAMLKYKNDDKVRAVMTKLCDTLGDNFLNLSQKDVNEEQSLVRDVMAEPKVQAAFSSPMIQAMMEHVKQGHNDIVKRMMAEASDEDRQHIRVLLDFGLFSFAC